jgi:hypothetical protein
MPEVYTLQVIAASKGRQFSIIQEIAFATAEGARAAAERMQEEYDEEAAPIRCYVLDSDGVAVHAGGARIRRRSQPASRGVATRSAVA